MIVEQAFIALPELLLGNTYSVQDYEAGIVGVLSLAILQELNGRNALHPIRHLHAEKRYVLSAKVLAEADDIFKPFHERVRNGMEKGEVMKLDMHYLNRIKAAQIGVCIGQALRRGLKGETLKAHIHTGFDIYWRGIAP